MKGDVYNTIAQPATAEYKDRGSRFLAFAFPIEDTNEFRARLQEVKKDHPKATHHCFAYRLGLEGLQSRFSDAGEPSGSAGRPILGQIDRLEATGVAVIVVRYFGGTLLGIPGLINAYRTAAALALQMTPLVTRPVERRYRMSFDYTVINAVHQIIKQHRCSVYRQEQLLFCEMEAGIPVAQEERCLNQLKGIRNLEIVAIP